MTSKLHTIMNPYLRATHKAAKPPATILYQWISILLDTKFCKRIQFQSSASVLAAESAIIQSQNIAVLAYLRNFVTTVSEHSDYTELYYYIQ